MNDPGNCRPWMQKAKVDTTDLGREAKKRSVDRSARVFATNRKGEFLGDLPMIRRVCQYGQPIHMLVSSGPL